MGVHIKRLRPTARVFALVACSTILDIALSLTDSTTAAHKSDAVEWGDATTLVVRVGGIREDRVSDSLHHFTSTAHQVLVGICLELAAFVGVAWVVHGTACNFTITAHVCIVHRVFGVIGSSMAPVFG